MSLPDNQDFGAHSTVSWEPALELGNNSLWQGLLECQAHRPELRLTRAELLCPSGRDEKAYKDAKLKNQKPQ